MVSFNKLTRTLAGIAAAALIVPLAACGGSGNGGTATAEGIPAKGTDDGTEITLWTRSPLERQAKNVVEAYNKSHKNQVKLEIIPNDDMEGKVGGASQTDSLSDILAGDVVRIPYWASEGIFTDITKQIDGLDNKADLQQGHIEAGTVDGAEYTLPFITDVSVMVWNKNLYKEAGLDPEQGPKSIDQFVEQAKKVAPAIIFIDEIDAVGRQRGSGLGGGHDEREQTLNQLLVEMDGFTNNEGVIVMAATNRADILDNALLRPGRFDRRVYMGLPDIKGREDILKVHARGKPLGDDVDLKSIARGTAGFAGADLENLLNEAAILATRSKRRFIMQEDIDEAILKVVMGPEKKSRIVSERARRLTAYHESGHAIASFFLKNSDPVHYITIIPRGAAGGFTWYRKAEDAEDFTSRGEMFDSIVSALGGRIAEQLFLDDISTGASGDIQQATNVARDMVMKYGMSEKLGPISFDDSSHSIFIGRDFGTTKSYSEETAATIDEEVKHIFDQAYAKCEALLREHADLLTGLAEYLLIHETIEGDDFRYYCEHGQMPIHPDDTIEPPAKVIRRMDEAPVAPQPDAETQPADGDTPDGGEKTE